MSFKKIIITFLLISFSSIQLVQASEVQNFTLTYSERTDVGGDVNEIIAQLEAQADQDSQKLCNGDAKQISESKSFYHGPWAISIVTLKFDYACAKKI